MEKRANGGIDLLNQIHQEKMNVYYLGHPDGGIQFHVYMTKEPQLKADGLPDMSGSSCAARRFTASSSPITSARPSCR